MKLGAFLLIWVIGIVGWVANVVQLMLSPEAGFSVLVAMKLIGILVAPLGSLLGIVGFF